MKERPILFSGPMVRAILDGRKTQTRRVVKPQPLHEEFAVCKYHKTLVDKKGNTYPSDEDRFGICDVDGEWSVECPYGQVSDRLWVREAWAVSNIYDDTRPANICKELLKENPGKAPTKVKYPASDSLSSGIRIRPSIHMPRWASRITLEITGVRVERLNDISKADAIAEGIEDVDPRTADKFAIPGVLYRFQHLWESINGPGSWADNPWVWAIEFRKHT